MVEVNIIKQNLNKPDNPNFLKDGAVGLDGTQERLLTAMVSVRLKF